MTTEYENDPLLSRPLTWAEAFMLREFYRQPIHRIIIDVEPLFWPCWLIRYVLKPLVSVGYIAQPYVNCQYIYDLTEDGRSILERYYPNCIARL